jgi:hypothetical protein
MYAPSTQAFHHYHSVFAAGRWCGGVQGGGAVVCRAVVRWCAGPQAAHWYGFSTKGNVCARKRTGFLISMLAPAANESSSWLGSPSKSYLDTWCGGVDGGRRNQRMYGGPTVRSRRTNFAHKLTSTKCDVCRTHFRRCPHTR